MKEFNLEEAKKGAPVQLRDGREARIVCFDMRIPRYPILAVFTDQNNAKYDNFDNFTLRGEAFEGDSSDCDLVMKSVDKEGWIIAHKVETGMAWVGTTIYTDRNRAENEAKKLGSCFSIMKITLEE